VIAAEDFARYDGESREQGNVPETNKLGNEMAKYSAKPIKLAPRPARAIVLNAQLLDGKSKLPRGKAGVLQAIEKSGYIQIDTIAMVQRAHHHTLWTRRPNYSPKVLDRLLIKDRSVFEYWGHAASYLPMLDYRFYLPRMHGFRNPKNKWVKRIWEEHGQLMKPLLEREPKNRDQFLASLATKLHDFAVFNDCDDIKIEKTIPGKFKRELKTLL